MQPLRYPLLLQEMKKALQKLREKRWFTIATNKYVMAMVGFSIWMLFLDVNSYLIHRQLNAEIEQLKEDINYYQSEIEKDERKLEELTSDPEKLEKFAREQFRMSKPEEIIYLIEES